MERTCLWLQRHLRWLKTMAFGIQQFPNGTESQLPSKGSLELLGILLHPWKELLLLDLDAIE